MDLGQTFCTGLRCRRTDTCALWTGNLKLNAESLDHVHFEGIGVTISIANFADYKGDCVKYLPIELEIERGCE